MKEQARTARVLIALVISMTFGAFVLMSLDNKTLSEGAFSLSSLYKLSPVKEQVNSDPQSVDWDGVEIYYSNPKVNTLNKLIASGNSDLHFIITGADCEKEGVIKSTEKWRSQNPCKMDLDQGQKIIRICILSGKSAQPTNCQVSRTLELVEHLSRIHNISSARIRYPVNWQI